MERNYVAVTLCLQLSIKSSGEQQWRKRHHSRTCCSTPVLGTASQSGVAWLMWGLAQDSSASPKFAADRSRAPTEHFSAASLATTDETASVSAALILFPQAIDTSEHIRFYRAMLCIRGTSHGPVSVCLSVCVCLSQVGVLLKQLKVGSHKHHTIVQGV